ncbi:MAG: hypothetical protein ACC707_07290 [Thiohalomonadales bacterium]
MYPNKLRNKLIPTYYISVLLFLILIFTVSSASAVPAFARKYQANCSLCHSNEPRLTPFGQRFLENGYQFPSTTDGNETSKLVFDGEQGPVTLDKLSNMMAVRIRGDIQRATFRDISHEMKAEGVDERTSVEFPKIVNFFFAGTVTDNISYFIEAEYNTMEDPGGETSVIFERTFMQFSNIGGAQGVTNFKIGRFDPASLFAFPTHRQQLNPILPIADTDQYPPNINRVPLLPLAFSSKMFGLSNATSAQGTQIRGEGGYNEGFALLPFEPTLYNAPMQSGMAVHGRPWGDGSPFLYQIGLAMNEKAADNFGHVEQRIDTYLMLRFDFDMAGAETQVSGFYYNAPDAARATLVNIMPAMNDATNNSIVYASNSTDINRYGIGMRSQWGQFDVYAAYIIDTIDEPQWGAAPLRTSEWETDGSALSAEVDWRFKKQWMLAVRYDYMQPGGLKRLPKVATASGSANDAINATVQFIAPMVKYYPSPNIGLYVRSHINITSSTTLPNTNGRVDGFSGQQHPGSNLQNMLTFGVDMAF